MSKIEIYRPVLIIQGSPKLSPAGHMACWIFFQRAIWPAGFSFRYKKTVMPKKKVLAARNLKDCYQVYHPKQESKKKKIKVFYLVNFMLP
jgi:hypothetical protein